MQFGTPLETIKYFTIYNTNSEDEIPEKQEMIQKTSHDNWHRPDMPQRNSMGVFSSVLRASSNLLLLHEGPEVYPPGCKRAEVPKSLLVPLNDVPQGYDWRRPIHVHAMQ